MMNFWTLRQFERITDGRWMYEPSPEQYDKPLGGVGIDSRTIEFNQVFIAVSGERFDGHDYVDKAFARGAACAIVERPVAQNAQIPQHPVLVVTDTVLALQQLGVAYRDVLKAHGCKVIAVTGSNGKTTTRHLIHTVLSARFKGTQSPKSFNNHLGVPLTILGANAQDQFLVAEVGTNHPGEIALLGAILRPDAVVITNIGSAHIGHFGSLAAIAEEKFSLLQFLEPEGIAFISRQAWSMAQSSVQLPVDLNWKTYGPEPASEDALAFDDDDQSPLTLTISGRPVQFRLLGQYNITNALAAVEVGKWLQLDGPTMAQALERVKPVPMRLEPREIGTTAEGNWAVTVINDAYNANPESIFQAFEVLRDYPVPAGSTHRRVAIIGDMLELGDEEDDVHTSLGMFGCSEWKVDVVIFLGQRTQAGAKAMRENIRSIPVHHFAQWTSELPGQIAQLLQVGDVILIKGSRSMAMERLLPAIEAKFSTVDAT